MSGPTHMSDLEDGEITDSDDPCNAEPKQFEDKSSVKHVAEELDQRVFPVQPRPSADRSYRSTRNPCLDSSGDSSSDEDDRDFDYDESPKKHKLQRTSNTQMDTMVGAEAHGNAFSQAADKFQSKKLWKEVVLEQTINDTMLKVNTTEKREDEQDRGVESYNFKTKEDHEKDRLAQRTELQSYDDDFLGGDLYGEGNVEMDNKSEEEETVVDIGDMETFGTDSSTRGRKRTIKDRLGKPNEQSDSRKPVKDRLGSKNDSRSNSPQERKDVKQRLGKRVYSRDGPLAFLSKARFNLDSKEDDAPEKIATDLVKALGEPEHQLELFFRVVTTLGVKTSLEVYYETESIEENGGMDTLSGHRRRSPGGVFLQLVKSHKDTTKEMVKKIFPDMNKKKFKKKKKNKNRGDGGGGDFSSTLNAYAKERSKAPAKSESMDTPMEAGGDQPQSKDDDLDDIDLEDTCVGIELDI